MKDTSLKFKTYLKKHLKLLIIFSALIYIPPALFAQDSSTDLKAALDKFNDNMDGMDKSGGGISTSSISSADGYKSFVQNELQNIYAQMDKMNEQEMADITFAEINDKRIDLSVQLCQKDERACFLVDEYKSYKSKEDIPKELEELELFGQAIFSGYSNDFNFYDSLPLDNNYILKLGDILKISLFGGFEAEESLEVAMNGSIIIAGIGEYQVAGLPFSEVSENIKSDVSNKFPGTEAYITLKSIRSKQIFALGNVRSPGTYALNAFGTALNALISSGGVKDNSSLRSLQVIRKNNTVKTIDLYDLLIKGDITSADFILNDGDSLLVGGLKSSVSIIGEVIRPAIYEIQDNQTLLEVISFALGTTPFADMGNVSVTRLMSSGEKRVLNPKDTSFILQNGDQIVINTSEGQTIQSIKLAGEIRNAGDYALEENLTLGSIINLNKDLLDNTYTGFGVVKRLNFDSKSSRLVMFNLSNQSQLNEFNLYSGDHIFVFSKDDIKYSQSKEVYSYLNTAFESNDYSNQFMESKDTNYEVCLSSLDVLMTNPISNFIKAKLALFPRQIALDCPELLSSNPDLLPVLIINSIPVVGNVRFPGLYPTTRDLNALEIFNLAGGVLVSKLNTIPSFDVGIRARGFGSYPYETLKDLTNISMLNLQIDDASIPSGFVTLKGEFANPGTYEISKGTTLSEIYNRAGGLTSDAYSLAGILTRESVRKIEEDAIMRSKAELSEILSSAVASGYLKQNSTDLIGLISLMTSLDDAMAVGRLVTELNPNLIELNPSLNIDLHDGDVIYMPKLLNTVTVVGQVLSPVTVPHKVGESFDYYIKLAGGMQKEADKSNIYALQPNGVSLRRRNGFQIPVLPFMPFERDDILPGATLVVPRQARPLDSLALVETITPVLANLSVTAASIAALSD
jgi:protein involved in polysaccharide export with SLBB domain